MAWFDSQGNYYEGDRANLADRGVPARPSAIHIFVDGEWVEDQVQVAVITAEVEKERQKAQAILDAFPSWAEVDAAITSVTTIAGIKVILRKVIKILYIIVKNKVD
jgi:adenylate kinase family enzyme